MKWIGLILILSGIAAIGIGIFARCPHTALAGIAVIIGGGFVVYIDSTSGGFGY